MGERSELGAKARVAMRMLCLWWPDWPVEVARRGEATPAGGSGSPSPVVVIERGCVRSASVEARAVGVRPGLRRREAEARCPGAVVVDADLGEEGRAFEVVAEAMEALTPKVAIERPGLLFLPTRGPSRRLGGDASLAEAALKAVRATSSGQQPCPVRVGVADGAFAARLAARRASAGEAFVVEAEGSVDFLAPWPVEVLEVPALASLLVRLGLPTLGSFASLSPSVVVSRFGIEGRWAHRRARGLDDEHPAWRMSPPDLVEG
ncbi:MAG: DNA polymerase Y family protein, partial [Acidimicrobiia bacterium]